MNVFFSVDWGMYLTLVYSCDKITIRKDKNCKQRICWFVSKLLFRSFKSFSNNITITTKMSFTFPIPMIDLYIIEKFQVPQKIREGFRWQYYSSILNIQLSSSLYCLQSKSTQVGIDAVVHINILEAACMRRKNVDKSYLNSKSENPYSQCIKTINKIQVFSLGTARESRLPLPIITHSGNTWNVKWFIFQVLSVVGALVRQRIPKIQLFRIQKAFYKRKYWIFHNN